MCNVKTEGKMMSNIGIRSGSGEKKSRLNRGIVIKLPIGPTLLFIMHIFSKRQCVKGQSNYC